jgi:hypothetical protein
MALAVEDGTGKPDADAYLSAGEFRTYCGKWGYDIDAFEQNAIEQSIRKATTYVDTCARYKGQRSTAGQEREFPRENLVDWSGHAVTGVPRNVVKATAELAFKGLSGPLDKDAERGGMVASKSVGPISVSYEAGAPAGMTYTAAMKLLEQYVRKGGDRLTGPFFSTTEAPTFTTGMHGNPPADGDA